MSKESIDLQPLFQLRRFYCTSRYFYGCAVLESEINHSFLSLPKCALQCNKKPGESTPKGIVANGYV